MGLPNRSFDDFVNAMVASWAASLGFPPTFSQTGDAFYSMMQTVAAQLVFIQAQVQLVNYVARAQTCGSDLNNGTTDADLDSFYAQFGFTRLPGQAAVGPVTLGKLSPATVQVLYPVGSVVQTVGGAISYALIADTNQPTFDPVQNAYVLQIGQSSLTATAQAQVSGSAYNVTAGQLAQVATPVPGLDTVTNPEPITNGADAESNPSFRSRFVLFLNSLSKATYGAISSAIQGVQQNIEFNLEENIDINGNPFPGEFIAVIDDGTGSPPSSLLAAVFSAVDAVRGFTIMPVVTPVQVVSVAVVITVKLAAGAVAGTVEAAVANAIITAINATGIGSTLFVSTVEAAALAVAGVVAVKSGTTLNGVAADLTVTVLQAARSNINLVTVSTY
jgi:uncharacterized phage protein gp47/JayE